MKKTALTLCAAIFAVSGLAAQAQQAPPAPPAAKPSDAPATVVGTWNISLDAGQGPMDIAATFKLDGKKLTGVLSSQMGDTALEGEFADGKATFGISFDGGGGSMSITFIGKMKDADHMEGTMSGPMGEVPWKGVRSKGE